MEKPDLGDFRQLCKLSGVTFAGVWFDPPGLDAPPPTAENAGLEVGLVFHTDSLAKLTTFGNHAARAGFNLTASGVYPRAAGDRWYVVFPVDRFALEAYPEALRAMGWDPETGQRLPGEPEAKL